jgi:hypothetical protein
MIKPDLSMPSEILWVASAMVLVSLNSVFVFPDGPSGSWE